MHSPGSAVSFPAGKVLSQLRHGPRIVDELARALRITGAAARNQRRKLQPVNLVARAGTRAGTSRPSALCGMTLEGQMRFPTLYQPVLTQLLRGRKGAVVR